MRIEVLKSVKTQLETTIEMLGIYLNDDGELRSVINVLLYVIGCAQQ